ncbi:MAG TPA: S8 family serine peptidase [Planctomycetota bacterium]|nr:S8 family serine peptidase [Planctomycetota bacterium]
MHSSARALAVLLLLAAGATGQNRPDPVQTVVPWQGHEVLAGELLVQFRPNVSAAAQSLAHKQQGVLPRAVLGPRLTRVVLPAGTDLEARRAAYAARPDVEFVQPNVLHHPVAVPDDPLWSTQWALSRVRAAEAWDSWPGSADAVVAVIDTGVDVDHPDLAAHYAWGLDTFAGDADPDDAAGHGTHCCGIANAVTDNGLGVAGAAPGCRFASYRCGNTSFSSSALVAAIQDAVAKGARVISMSWGSTYDDPAIRSALQAASDAGCLLVAAAGNDNSSTPFYPAALPFVLAVGASNSGDNRASFSNYGAWVDLAAPGESIDSTWLAGGTAYLSGTSMATPLVAGAGLLLYGRLGQRTPAHAAAVRAALEQSGAPVGNWVAHGRLDMAAAMDQLFPSTPPQLTSLDPPELPALHGTTVTLTGSGLWSTTSVTVAGAGVSFALVDGTHLTFTAPDAPVLGPGTLSVSTPAGTDDLGFTWVETDPPRLVVPAQLAGGSPCTWSLGGPVGDGWFLLLALDANTFSYAGQQILVPLAMVKGSKLGATGLASLQAFIPAAAAGLAIRSQLVTWDGDLSGASPIETTTID